MTVTVNYLGICMLGEREWVGVGIRDLLDNSTTECMVETSTLHSYKSQAEKHIHNMTTIFYSYGCISVNDLP